ncbi:sigma-54-dependent Fis family transcriptional regulator [candidate division WOR-3 bacterium]|nr:sigma-54-dependent Fis family transcriptional regulator [candidate division WOR-3 bacterium]
MGKKGRVLIIDDDPKILELLSKALKDNYSVFSSLTGSGGLEIFKNEILDAALVDIKLPDMDGLDVLVDIKKTIPDFPVIIITGHASIPLAVKAMKLGAFYFVKKPFELEEITSLLDKAIEHSRLLRDYRRLQNIASEKYSFSGIIGRSKKMKEIFEIIKLVASTDVTVLIEGESGTGKELVAKAIHVNSPRKDKNFVPVNCSALPETLLESELFGYKKGAFTGAATSKPGLFEEADGGTLFLDEIGSTSPAFQSKLLRVLEDGMFYHLGSTKPVKVDVRIIAATNVSLEEAVQKNLFREDLFYRLNVVKLRLPPLRERRNDIPLLVNHFLKYYANKHNKNIKGVSDKALALLVNYHWPGNVRELENVIERAVILTTTDTIDEHLLPDKMYRADITLSETEIMNYKKAKEIFERNYLTNLLRHTKGNVSLAARIAGQRRQNLYIKFKYLGINPKDFI